MKKLGRPYDPPIVEMENIMVEAGFAASLTGDPGETPPLDNFDEHIEF